MRGNAFLYTLEYSRAVSEFEHSLQAHPNDPFAVNNLLQAVLLGELYRLNALDTTLYADNGFLTGKPLAGDPKVKERIRELAELGIVLAERRLKVDPNDKHALYARGVTKGLRLSYAAIIEKAFFASLRNAAGSRSDHERVLQLDPRYTDAKMIVGVHNFVLGSLPFGARMIAGVAGMSGNKKKGIEMLYEVSRSSAQTSVDARVALALFLRREAKYTEALGVMRTLTVQHPRNFIFALEEANLMKDAGMGKEAVQAYANVVSGSRAGNYPNAHLERALFGLAESQKGQRLAQAALQSYLAALEMKEGDVELRTRAALGAGQMHDVLGHREQALVQYQQVIRLSSGSSHAELARKHLRSPYKFPS